MTSSTEWSANGPTPSVPATIAMTDIRSAHGALPASWKRSAAQTSTGKRR